MPPHAPEAKGRHPWWWWWCGWGKAHDARAHEVKGDGHGDGGVEDAALAWGGGTQAVKEDLVWWSVKVLLIIQQWQPEACAAAGREDGFLFPSPA